ncbi:MAG: MscL family protein [Bacilli bacterium]|nr:MscL family protein [Bacilli bacterium]
MAKLTKEEKRELKRQRKAAGEGLVNDFKKFITRGNVLDMAVGVIIGGAFNAIVTAFVNILMSICTWRVPGGIKGLVTVLPAANDAQKGMNTAIGLGQKFEASQLHDLATKLANETYTPEQVQGNLQLIESAKSTIIGKYNLHGTTYVYKLSSTIDWGTFINAVISFLIVAVTLFVVVKVAARMKKFREDLNAKISRKNTEEELEVE